MINKYSAIPLYSQLADEIIERIESGEFPVNSKLPSEREICGIYDISRTTVRQAIQELQRLGRVNCLHGKGNYITSPVMSQQLMTIYSFSEEMRKLGKTPSTRLIGHRIIQSDQSVAAQLQIKAGTPVYKFERVRLADDEPVLLATTYLPVERFPGLRGERLAEESLYKIMCEDYKTNLTEVHESMQAVLTRRAEAQLLGVSVNEPAMMIRRRSFEGPKVVEYAVGVARGDSFKYEVVLKNR